MEATSWSREGVFKMAREAEDAGELVTHYVGAGDRWGYDEMLPDDLSTIGVIGSTWKPHHKKVFFRRAR